MNLHAVDWLLVAVFTILLIGVTLYCRRFADTVTGFLAAERVAGRYLLTVSQGLGGAISIVAMWEMIYAAGLPTQWWAMMSLPVALVLSLTGFVIYRFRQTRALTLSEFFEVRYSRRFRFFAGLLAWVSGILNYGIFPAVTARFLIYLFGFPSSFHLGMVELPTYPMVMAGYLSLALFTALVGGQISIMLGDFFQGILTLLVLTVIFFFIIGKFSWMDISAGLQMAPSGESMINPFQTSHASDFSVGYFLIALFGQIYNARSWQGNSGFNVAASTPHEAKMAGILGQWRGFVLQISLLLIPLAAYAVFHHPSFANLSGLIQADLATITDPTIRTQMTVPVFVTHILPAGMLGLFAVVVLSSAVSCDNSYLHSWGSIFIQDVVLPLRRKPISAKAHLLLLRLSIVSVAVFGFCFSLLFPIKGYVLMYFAVTAAIYAGGIGAVLIGGLYWERGTTTAAWVAMATGSSLAFGGLLLDQFWSSAIAPALLSIFSESAWLMAHAQKFPLNGQIIYFLAMVIASLLYIFISLWGPQERCDMDKLLHRGAYALPEDELAGSVHQKHSWRELLGLTREFTVRDRVVFWATVGWSLAWWLIFMAGLAVNYFWGISDGAWSWFWWGKIWLSALLGIFFIIWFSFGGVRDVIYLFRNLRSRAGAVPKENCENPPGVEVKPSET